MFESELSDHIPVIKTSIAGTRLTGRMCVGNRNGLLLPNSTTDQELQHIRNSLPDEVGGWMGGCVVMSPNEVGGWVVRSPDEVGGWVVRSPDDDSPRCLWPSLSLSLSLFLSLSLVVSLPLFLLMSLRSVVAVIWFVSLHCSGSDLVCVSAV